jgi:small subunit ribosomal protein S2
MNKPTYKELLDAGVHFGHLKKKWNPKMSPYIFMERKGIHIIDLNRTSEGLDRAANAMRALAKSGKKVLFVATKKQARDIVMEAARRAGMPFVCDRWLGGHENRSGGPQKQPSGGSRHTGCRQSAGNQPRISE